jgi:hypothetical protein
LQEQARGRTPKNGKETGGKAKGFDGSIRGGDLPGGIKLDEEHFGGERILHVGSIPRVRGIGIAANVWLCGFFICSGFVRGLVMVRGFLKVRLEMA